MRSSSARSVAALLLLCSIAATGILAGCGRGSFVGRSADDFSAYYNTFYNARQAFNEGTQPLRKADPPIDQNMYLPVFAEPAQVQNEEAFAKAIEKSADLLRQHPRSKWVDDALLLIGKAYYYRENYVGAERKFREIIDRGGPLEGEARFWLGRALLSSGNHPAAERRLTESLAADTLAERWAAHMKLLLGDLHVRRGAWLSAAERLADGLAGVRDGRTRARAFFLRGQALETMGRHADAARSYRSAAQERPRYELAYAAQASALRADAQAGQSGVRALRQLRRLERDDKNESKRVELALLRGRFYQAQGRPGAARRHYTALLYPGEKRDAPAVSAGVRGRAHYALATLYRDAYGNFTRAAAHFDTAATALAGPAQPAAGAAALLTRYAITDSRSQAERYGRVAEASSRAARLDSLLRLGALSEEDFGAFVDSLRQVRAEAERTAERQQARRRAEQRFQPRGRTQTRRGSGPVQPAAGGEAGFLFHRDPIQVQQGLLRFVRRWGERPRVPNWRRRAAISSQAEAEAPGEPTETIGPDDELATPLRPHVDVSDVPRSAARLRAMRAERAAAHYHLGNALLLAAERPDSAAVWFRRVIEEAAGTSVARRARYALAEAERAAGRAEAAHRQYRRVIREQPATELARRAQQRLSEAGAGQVPSPASSPQTAEAQDAYARAYRRWQGGEREPALQQMLDVAAAYPEAPSAPRALLAAARIFMEWSQRAGHALDAPLPARLPDALRSALLDSAAVPTADSTAADSVAEARNALTLDRLLAGLVRRYPNTPHASRARRMLRALREHRSQRFAARQAPPDSLRADSPLADSSAGGTPRVPTSERASGRVSGRAQRLRISTRKEEQTPGGVQRPDSTRAERRSWVIVVASAGERAEAEAIAERFRQRLSGEGHAVCVIAPSQAPRARSPRHHVGVGRFESRAEAQAARRHFPSALPAESWLLRAQPVRE